MTAMPLLIGVLCLMAIAYRYYSAFLAARVAVLDDSQKTPAYALEDGRNYHPTNKWVLFGHHFAAISGAGPLIGPVLAAQFGYLPGLLWIVIGVCLAGAVQDFLVLSISVRHEGKSLAQIAYAELGKISGTAATVAILVIITVALAGLGKVVVKALGGEEVKFPPGSVFDFKTIPEDHPPTAIDLRSNDRFQIPAGTTLVWNDVKSKLQYTDKFWIRSDVPLESLGGRMSKVPAGAVRIVPGSSWGTFTIALTIPIALFVGLYMYKLRPGHVVEASLIGAALTLGATVLGGWVSQQPAGHYFNLTAVQVTVAMAIYGFIASVLPVWVLLCPRDYLSSFLKIGTIALLVVGVIVANPKLEAPAYNAVFAQSGPVVKGSIFPFLFITIMCGAISGFHALVSSGTTPKMVKRERDIRTIGYGAMLIEGIVGVVAMIAATTLPVNDYYAMNTELAKVPEWHDRILQVGGAHGVGDLNPEGMGAGDNVANYERLTEESLRGRVGGAVTLAVGMAHIFDKAAARFVTANSAALEAMWRYWYHFAIMFEALFILTTIDTGTRIGRFLLQEVLGKFHPSLGLKGNWIAGALSTGIIVLCWAKFMHSDNFSTIWAIFGIANQLLAMIALAVVTAYLIRAGRGRYLWVTLLPMLFVMTTTSTAAGEMLRGLFATISTQLGKETGRDGTILFNATMQATLLLAMALCGATVILATAKCAYDHLVKPDKRRSFETV